MPPTVDRAALGPMTEIAAGGFGIVYRLETFRLPGYGPLAYKEFLAPPDPPTAANLEQIITFHDRLPAARRAIVDGCAAWPLRVVVDRGAVVGLVMPLVPEDFFFVQQLPSGKPDKRPIAAQWLIVSQAKVHQAGAVAPAPGELPDRLVLCAKLAHVLGVLHRDGLVYGDLSENNVLFTMVRPPRIMLIDCDAAAAPSSGLVQSHSPNWVPPEITKGRQRHQDAVTDCYKLALFILRCLSPGDYVSQTTDPDRMKGVLDGEGVRLIRSGLSADRSGRPTAKQWYGYLTRYLADLTQPPLVSSLTVDKQLVMAGAAVTVEWEVRGASRGVLRTPDGRAADVDIGTGSHTLPALSSGALTLTVENEYGQRTTATDPVYLFSPPRIESVSCPEPPLPGPDPGIYRDLTAVLDRIGTNCPAGPLVELPELVPVAALPQLPVLAADPPPALDGVLAVPLPGSGQLAALAASVAADAAAVLAGVAAASTQAVRYALPRARGPVAAGPDLLKGTR